MDEQLKAEQEYWKSIRPRRGELTATLLSNIKAHLPELEALLASCDEGEWGFEDDFYRFYHHSFKVFYTNVSTNRIVEALKKLMPEGCRMNRTFLAIVEQGLSQKFGQNTNENWEAETRPVLEAYFHARHFLQQVIKYGKALDEVPQMLPTGWATVLYLYGLR